MQLATEVDVFQREGAWQVVEGGRRCVIPEAVL